MWQSAINYLRNLRTYQDLSPDAGIRRRINIQLCSRPSLAIAEWSGLFANQSSEPVSHELLVFVYDQLPVYSGLEIGKIRPSDRLIDDLQLPLVCWFDWPHQLCCDFYEAFQVDISEEFDESLLETIGDLVWFLNKQLKSPDSIVSG